MRNVANIHRPLAIAALAVLATGALAPLAEASHRRYRGPVVERRVVRRVVFPARAYRVVPRGSYAVWRSGSGPVVAGFLGGLFLGATISHAAPEGFVYWDPYCHRSFASLEVYDSHCSRYSHPSVIQVVEGSPGCDPGDLDVRDGGDPEGRDDDQR